MGKDANYGTFYDKIFVINGTPQDPTALDYDLQGLHKEREPFFVDGLLKTVKYWANYDGVTYSNLAVQEDRDYVIPAGTDLVQQRNMVISWFFEDGTVGTTKSTTKYYSPIEQISEGKTRRNNVIESASVYLIGKIGIPQGQKFLITVGALIPLYISGARQPLIDAVANTAEPYMTADILAELNTRLAYKN